MFRFPSPDRPIFFRKVKKKSRFTGQRSKYFNVQAHDLVLLTTIGMMRFPCLQLRACLHGGGGPQVGEVTRLAVVEKWPAFTCKLTTPGSRGDFT